MVTLQEYEKLTGYTPRVGEKCPECGSVCGPGGPDHHTACGLMAKVWFAEKNPLTSIPIAPGIDPHDPKFGPWAVKLATSLLAGQVAAIPKHITPPPPQVPAAVPAPIA